MITNQGGATNRRLLIELRVTQIFLVLVCVAIVFLVDHNFFRPPSLIQAREINIVDHQGKQVVQLGRHSSGSGFLKAFSKEGREVLFLGAENEGSGLIVVKDSQSRPLAALTNYQGKGGAVVCSAPDGELFSHLGASVDGVPNFSLYYKGKTLMNAGVNQHGNSALSLFQADGKPVCQIGADEKNSFLGLYSKTGKAGAYLFGEPEGGAFKIYNDQEISVLTAGWSGDGSAALKIWSSDGQRQIMETGTTGKGGIINIFSEKGETIFSAGQDSTRGHGLMSLRTGDGEPLLLFGPDAKQQGGVINIYDWEGKMSFRFPDWP